MNGAPDARGAFPGHRGEEFLGMHGGQGQEQTCEGHVGAGHFSRPAFLIIGAQKAGTSALHHYLSRHPNVVPARKKEIGFFCPEAFQSWSDHPDYVLLSSVAEGGFYDPDFYVRATQWYHAHFPLPHELGSQRMTYEATPEYLYFPEVPKRIAKYNPLTKLIVLLRDPAERAFSAWNMFRGFQDLDAGIYRQLAETRGFDEAVQDEIARIGLDDASVGSDYVRRGLYHEQLRRYFVHFPRAQVLVLDTRDLKHRTSALIQEIIAFLGLPPYRGEEFWPARLVGEYRTEIPIRTRDFLREFYKPHNGALYQLLERNFGWDSA
jgi:hypothetical protein